MWTHVTPPRDIFCFSLELPHEQYLEMSERACAFGIMYLCATSSSIRSAEETRHHPPDGNGRAHDDEESGELSLRVSPAELSTLAWLLVNSSHMELLGSAEKTKHLAASMWLLLR